MLKMDIVLKTCLGLAKTAASPMVLPDADNFLEQYPFLA